MKTARDPARDVSVGDLVLLVRSNQNALVDRVHRNQTLTVHLQEEPHEALRVEMADIQVLFITNEQVEFRERANKQWRLGIVQDWDCEQMRYTVLDISQDIIVPNLRARYLRKVREKRSERLNESVAIKGTESFYLGQLIQFEELPNRTLRKGKILSLNVRRGTCDIAHDSDENHISHDVDTDRVSSLSERSSSTFHLGAHVKFLLKGRRYRRGRIIKVRNRGAFCKYDIQENVSGTIHRNIAADRVSRASFWDDVSGRVLALRDSVTDVGCLEKGKTVRFLLDDEWVHGTVVRLLSDKKSCVVEYCDRNEEKMTKVTVPNTDIVPNTCCAQFVSYLLTTVIDQWPHVPTTPIPIGTCVDVLQGSCVHLAIVHSIHADDKNDPNQFHYIVQYLDGSKEKHVSQDRIHYSLRRIPIGTKVEMVLEGPSKEVNKLSGMIVWVHMNERVAVQVDGHADSSDVFAEVKLEALLIHGKPAFQVPMQNTRWELAQNYASVLIEVLVYGWFSVGMMVEVLGMVRVYEETGLLSVEYLNGLYSKQVMDSELWQNCIARKRIAGSDLVYPYIKMEDIAFNRFYLLVLLVLKVIGLCLSVFGTLRVVYYTLEGLQDNFVDIEEHYLNRIHRRWVRKLMGQTLLLSLFCLIVYVSLFNHFQSHCLFFRDISNSSRVLNSSELTLAHVTLHWDNLFHINETYDTILERIVHIAGYSAMNLIRALSLHLTFEVASAVRPNLRVLVLIPAVGITGIITITVLAGINTFYVTHLIAQNDSHVSNSALHVTLLTLSITVWWTVRVTKVIIGVGQYWDNYLDRERRNLLAIEDGTIDRALTGDFGLQAKKEAWQMQTNMKQDELGIIRISVLRLQHYSIHQIVWMLIAIIASSVVHSKVMSRDNFPIPNPSGTSAFLALGHGAVTIQLTLFVIWLFFCVISRYYAKQVQSKIPNMYSRILTTHTS